MGIQQKAYNEGIEDVLVVLRSEFGMWTTSPLYKSIESLKNSRYT